MEGLGENSLHTLLSSKVVKAPTRIPLKLVFEGKVSVDSERLEFSRKGLLLESLKQDFNKSAKRLSDFKNFKVKKFSRSELEMSKNFLTHLLTQTLGASIDVSIETENSLISNAGVAGSSLVHSLGDNPHQLNRYLGEIEREFQFLEPSTLTRDVLTKQTGVEFLQDLASKTLKTDKRTNVSQLPVDQLRSTLRKLKFPFSGLLGLKSLSLGDHPKLLSKSYCYNFTDIYNRVLSLNISPSKSIKFTLNTKNFWLLPGVSELVFPSVKSESRDALGHSIKASMGKLESISLQSWVYSRYQILHKTIK
jgi:hypothetical protein